MTIRNIHIILIISCSFILTTELVGQSASFGNTFIHNNGESVIFGLHDFDKGSSGVIPGIVGTERTTPNPSNYGILGFSDGGPGWKGIGDDSYVDGYVKKYGDQPFVFPIGNNGKYRPVAINGGDGTIAAYYKVDPAMATTNNLWGGNYVELPEGGPFPQSSKNNIIVEVSDLEYWDIDGTNPTKITLTWDIFSEIERITNDELSKLRIVGWDGTKWEVIPSKMDPLYLNKTRSTPFYNGGISNKIKGSITTLDPIRPDDYLVYSFGAVAAGSIGDFVWEDMNRNGIQEVGEPGIQGVEIGLYMNSMDSLIMTTTSDQNGRYAFGGVPPGIFYLKFTPEDSYVPTLTNQGILALNSDLLFNNTTPPFEIQINEDLYGMDGGYYQTGSIGGLVWMDDNNDGIQDPNEMGMGGVTVDLINEFGAFATTVSNDDGTYAFTNRPPGMYSIRVLPPDGHNIGPYKSTLDETLDSDIDPLTMMSTMISLVSGQEIDDIDIAISNECPYHAEIDITSPDCGLANGSVQAIIDGDADPDSYMYMWSTGSTNSFIENIDTGHYTLMITDEENCTRAFNIDVGYDMDCNLICAEIDAHVFLEGPYDYDDERMARALNHHGYLPGQRPTTLLGKYTEAGQPYDEEPWYMAGTEGLTFESSSTAENNLYYEEDIVDWVLVSLRSRVDAEYETCTRAGVLHQDGHISFVEENCCLVDPNVDYYIVIEHRNHLIVMSPQPVSVSDGTLTHDFRAANSYIRLFGNGQKEIAPGVFAMYAANGDQATSVESAVDINVGDLSEWLRQNGEHSSYYNQDYDLSGDANVQDKGMYLKNIGIFTDVPKGN